MFHTSGKISVFLPHGDLFPYRFAFFATDLKKPQSNRHRIAISAITALLPAIFSFNFRFHGCYFVSSMQPSKIRNVMKTKTLISAFLGILMMTGSLSFSQNVPDSVLISQARRFLLKANVMNGLSIGMGVASNVEMAIIGGFPLEYENGLNPGVNVSHLVLATSRFTFSLFPPIMVGRASAILRPLKNSARPEYAKFFRTLDAAQALTIVAPVLCLSGGIMMAVAATNMDAGTNYDTYHRTLKNPSLKTAGWILVGAGLAASVAGTILTGNARAALGKNAGNLQLTSGADGIGLSYNFPTK